MVYKAVIKRKSDDELMHWKYIRREYDIGTGKYKYYYENTSSNNAASKYEYKPGAIQKAKYQLKDKLGYDEKTAYETMKNTVNMHQDFINNALDQRRRSIGRIYSGRPDIDVEVEKGIIENLIDPVVIAERRDLKEAEKTCKKALAEYKKTPMYKIDRTKERVSSGISSVKKALRKLTKY